MSEGIHPSSNESPHEIHVPKNMALRLILFSQEMSEITADPDEEIT
jgi:hypothetical protein